MPRPAPARKARRKALPRVVIAGGAGTLGQALADDLLYLGYDVYVLTRTLRPGLRGHQVQWDGLTVHPQWGALLKGSVLINLAGELVDRPNTPENTALLTTSRVDPTLALVEASKVYGRPSTWLQMSTLAIYGDGGNTRLSEDSPVADGPAQMAGVATAWEAAAKKTKTGRLVILRTGVVLGHGMPAWERLVAMTRWFLGGTVGSGEQYVSWIHVADFLRTVRFLLLDDRGKALTGVVHVTAPGPVPNRRLMRSLRSRFHRPPMPATPPRLVEWGAKYIFRTDPALGLTGRRCYPDRLEAAGFEFLRPTLASALDDLTPSARTWKQRKAAAVRLLQEWKLAAARWLETLRK